jgi:hypothetical protein
MIQPNQNVEDMSQSLRSFANPHFRVGRYEQYRLISPFNRGFMLSTNNMPAFFVPIPCILTALPFFRRSLFTRAEAVPNGDTTATCFTSWKRKCDKHAHAFFLSLSIVTLHTQQA